MKLTNTILLYFPNFMKTSTVISAIFRQCMLLFLMSLKESLVRIPNLFLLGITCFCLVVCGKCFILLWCNLKDTHGRIQRGDRGFPTNIDLDHLKITKLPSQHSMVGHYWHASETPFQWRFAGGPMNAHF